MEVNLSYTKRRELNNLSNIHNGVVYTESWKDIIGYEGHYMVSSFGRIMSLNRKVPHGKSGYITMPDRILSQKIRTDGYAEVNLSKDGMHKMHSVHILVATYFVEKPKNKIQVNHKEGKTLDNIFHKLEWVTASENMKHSYDILNRKPTPIDGIKNPNYRNYRMYLNIITGIYYSVYELSELLAIKVNTLRDIFIRRPKDIRIANFIKA